jgi:hypothetical protein
MPQEVDDFTMVLPELTEMAECEWPRQIELDGREATEDPLGGSWTRSLASH